MPLLYTSFFGRGAAGGGGGNIQYVGGKIAANVGTTSPWTTVLTDLTGGLAAAPAADDLVIIAYGVGGQVDLSIGINTSGYTEIAELFADDDFDANLSVNRKFMSGSPDTSVEMSQTFNNQYAAAVAIQVWRGVNQTTPMDVTATTATGIDSPNVDPPSITPSTTGAVIICCGTKSTVGSAFSASDLSNFLDSSQTDTVGVRVGMGSKAWTGGAFDGAAWNADAATTRSWAAVTLALRPA